VNVLEGAEELIDNEALRLVVKGTPLQHCIQRWTLTIPSSSELEIEMNQRSSGMARGTHNVRLEEVEGFLGIGDHVEEGHNVLVVTERLQGEAIAEDPLQWRYKTIRFNRGITLGRRRVSEEVPLTSMRFMARTSCVAFSSTFQPAFTRF